MKIIKLTNENVCNFDKKSLDKLHDKIVHNECRIEASDLTFYKYSTIPSPDGGFILSKEPICKDLGISVSLQLYLFDFFWDLCPEGHYFVKQIIALTENLKRISKVEVKDSQMDTYKFIKFFVNCTAYREVFSEYLPSVSIISNPKNICQ